MAGADNITNRKDISAFQPMSAGTPQAYISDKSAGVCILTATIVCNSGTTVTAVPHSLGVTPSAWYAMQEKVSQASKGLAIAEASAPNNSVIGVIVTGYSAGDAVSAGYRFVFFPPAT